MVDRQQLAFCFGFAIPRSCMFMSKRKSITLDRSYKCAMNKKQTLSAFKFSLAAKNTQKGAIDIHFLAKNKINDI